MVDPKMEGPPLFNGARAAINRWLQYFENDYSREEFLECFASACSLAGFWNARKSALRVPATA